MRRVETDYGSQCPALLVNRRLLLLLAVWVLCSVGSAGTVTADGPQTAPEEATVDADARGEWAAETGRRSERIGLRQTAAARDSRDGNTTLNVSYTYRQLPSERGVVAVTMRIPPTDGVDRIELGVGEGSTVVETDGLVRAESGYVWNGTRPARVVYRLRITETYVGNARESWTLVQHQPLLVRADTGTDVNETITVADRGYVGNRTVLLGAHEVYRRQVTGETITLVVPGEVSLRYGPNRTVAALAAVSRSLDVGARGEVHAFVTPKIRTEATQLEVDGFALGRETVLLDANVELAAWIHEYVHTRQSFAPTESLRWLTEGSARYYEWLLAVETGYADWGELRGVFSTAANDDSVLAKPDTWRPESNYAKGARVLAAIDREIRNQTDGERTLEDVIRRLNDRDGPQTVEAFVRAVREVGGPAAARTAERYVTTGRVPDVPSRDEEFAAVYNETSPELRTRVVATTAANATRNRRVTTTGVIPLGLNETFRLRVRVTNTGSQRGLAAVTPRLTTNRLGGNYFDTTWVGWVGPNETLSRTVTHQFEEPGYYDIRWQDGQYTVRVAPNRGTATVTDVNVTRSKETLAVTATVRNGGNRTTFASFPVTVDGTRVATAALVLDGGRTDTVTVRVEAPAAGTSVGVGGVDRVVSETTAQTDTASRSGAGAGTTRATADALGPGIALLVVVIASVGLVRLSR
ncbi:MAG: hypothetical protein ABEI75_00865 [Halobaculum sp.]